MVPELDLLQRSTCVVSGLACLHRLPLLPALDGINNDPGPKPNDHDASNHLPRDHETSALGRASNITESNRREHRDSEVQGISTRERLAEVGLRNSAHNEIRAGKQQQKQWNARRQG